MNIAVILTCHNRKSLTLQSLVSLKKSIDLYNQSDKDKVNYMIYLTDDGCTDGTVEALKEILPVNTLHVIKGDGNLFWAGGMRKAWNEAISDVIEWDFYLLLNDDTIVNPSAVSVLMEAHRYSLATIGKSGLYSGICCDPKSGMTTYGGDIWTNRLLGLTKRLSSNGKPQECDMANANILLVSKEVVKGLGIFYQGFIHGKADHDYSIQAKKKGYPLFLTSDFCGVCSNDHGTTYSYKNKVLGMNLAQRVNFFKHPLNSNADYLLFIKRNTPWRYPLVWLGRFLNVYCPQVYYMLRRN